MRECSHDFPGCKTEFELDRIEVDSRHAAPFRTQARGVAVQFVFVVRTDHGGGDRGGTRRGAGLGDTRAVDRPDTRVVQRARQFRALANASRTSLAFQCGLGLVRSVPVVARAGSVFKLRFWLASGSLYGTSRMGGIRRRLFAEKLARTEYTVQLAFVLLAHDDERDELADAFFAAHSVAIAARERTVIGERSGRDLCGGLGSSVRRTRLLCRLLRLVRKHDVAARRAAHDVACGGRYGRHRIVYRDDCLVGKTESVSATEP